MATKGEKMEEDWGGLSKDVGMTAERGTGEMLTKWGESDFRECLFSETLSGQMSRPSWGVPQYNKVSCLFLH